MDSFLWRDTAKLPTGNLIKKKHLGLYSSEYLPSFFSILTENNAVLIPHISFGLLCPLQRRLLLAVLPFPERCSKLKTQALPLSYSCCSFIVSPDYFNQMNIWWFLQTPEAVSWCKERWREKEKIFLHFDDLKAFSMFILFWCGKVQLVNC